MPEAFHNLRSASTPAISVRTPYLVNRQSDVYDANFSSNAFASFRSSVLKPSANQP